MKEAVLWHQLVDAPEHSPVLTEDLNVDVCVIGAGYTGLSAAIHLAQAGKKVAILEAHHVGYGGSGRNVGYVNAGTWAPPDELNKYLGEKAGERLSHELSMAPKLVFDTIDRFNIDAQDTRTGTVHMAHHAQAESDIEKRYEQLKRRGAEVVLLNANECQAYVGSRAVRKALLDKRAGTINPYAYVVGLAQAAKRLGVLLFEQTKVKEMVSVSGQWEVATEQAMVRAERVVIASNAYTEGQWTTIQKTIYPVSFYQIASKPLDPEISETILPQRQGAYDTRLALSSIRRDKAGRLILGTVGSPHGKNFLYHAWANTMLKHYFPMLKGLEWECYWTGCFGFTKDHIMRIYEHFPGVICATGFNGRGITTGTLFGQAMAKYLLTGDRQVLPLDIYQLDDCKISYRQMRGYAYDAGIAIYHAGQCLKIVA
ncbi:L-pipecolate oxidase [Basilea psittacipulmonis]|uniref:FAD-dependent oxidoreductase n=1 Tax=Basilea psittacipulmonis DSM 24701 TaxID=1072685 RepID=A0A077DG64_9BURK|nr:FAD-binding oxidoreductase [Basilea psittacipulmonis]AIL32148.1 FAD-dependent oxidoreductase [Basilea psittacipulmonis DSM 24701]